MRGVDVQIIVIERQLKRRLSHVDLPRRNDLA